MKATAYGYAHDITDVEASKPKALASLIANFHENRIGVYDGERYVGRFPAPPQSMTVDVDQVVYTPYRHGTLNLQAAFTFDYPQEHLA